MPTNKMNKRNILINQIPAILWGDSSNGLYLYVHGQGGCKEEAELFANIAYQHGWQVLSIDLPGYGERTEQIADFDPWHVVPELEEVLSYAKERWDKIALFANSIGAWFSMLAFSKEPLHQAFFLSPVVDMKHVITKMMQWANVTEEQLREQKVIETSFGQTLYWEYWQYVLAHPIEKWSFPTDILYGGKDHLIDRNVVESFTKKFQCNLSVMEEGEHWFHTPEQLEVETKWVKERIEEA